MDSWADMDYRRLFEDQLELIEEVVRFACRRRGFTRDEAEDFRSYVHLKLIDQDYAILRKFQGKSSLKTYLITVTIRLGLDYRIAKWGKWRPSKKTERLGGPAVLLERLLYRDGYSLEEAIQIMRINHGLPDSPEALRSLAEEIPVRTRRRFEDEEVVSELVGPEPHPDQRLVGDENQAAIQGIQELVAKALSALEVEDRLILRMRYEQGLGVSTIAGALDLEPRPLYRRFERLLKTLRRQLQKQGVSTDHVQEVLGDVASDRHSP